MADYSITKLNISQKGLTQLPDDIDKYTNLRELYCSCNELTNLDNLPQSLEILYCLYNPLIYNFDPTLDNIRNYYAT